MFYKNFSVTNEKANNPAIKTSLVLALSALCLLVPQLRASAAPDQSDKKATQSAAMEALNNLRCDEAIRNLTPALNRALEAKDNASAALTMRTIALAFRLDENDAAALQAVSIAAKLNPDDIRCKFQKADYFFRNGLWKECEAEYEQLSKSSDPQISLRAKAFLAHERDYSIDATDLLEEYTSKYKDDQKALLKLANIYDATDEPELAAKTFKQLADLSDSNYLKIIYLGKAESAAKNTRNAIKAFQDASKICPTDPLWHYCIAMIEMKNLNIKAADKEFKECFKCKRLSSQAFVNWALMQSYFGSKADAEASLSYLAKMRPNSSELYFIQGVIAKSKGEYSKAKEAFLHSAQLNPHNSPVYTHLLELASAAKDPKSRLEICKQWTAACPKSVNAQIELANSLNSSGYSEKAFEAYLKAEELFKGRQLPSGGNYLIALCKMHANIATFLWKQKKFADALVEAKIFNQIRPAMSTTAGLSTRPPKFDFDSLGKDEKRAAEHAALADTLFETANLNSAEQEYREALKDDPNNVIYHSCLLKVLLDKKDFAAAAKEDAAVSQHVVTHIPDFFNSKQQKPTLTP